MPIVAKAVATTATEAVRQLPKAKGKTSKSVAATIAIDRSKKRKPRNRQFRRVSPAEPGIETGNETTHACLRGVVGKSHWDSV